VGNKADVAGTDVPSALLRERAATDGAAYFEVSAVTGKGVDSMVRAVAERVFELRSAVVHDAVTYRQVWTHDVRGDREYEVENLGGHVFEVHGRGVERMVIMTEWNNEEAIAFLQKRLAKAGVERSLAEAGALDGDEIRIAGRAFEFEGALERDPEVAFIEDEFDEDEQAAADSGTGEIFEAGEDA
jgi:GTP-binding protein